MRTDRKYGSCHVPDSSFPEDEKLEVIFRHKVFKKLLAKGRIIKDPTGAILDSRSSTVNAYFRRIKPPWKTWPGASSGLFSSQKDDFSTQEIHHFK